MLSVFCVTRTHPLDAVLQCHRSKLLHFGQFHDYSKQCFCRVQKCNLTLFQKPDSLTQDFHLLWQTTPCVSLIGIHIHNSQLIWNRLFTEILLNWLSFY